MMFSTVSIATLISFPLLPLLLLSLLTQTTSQKTCLGGDEWQAQTCAHLGDFAGTSKSSPVKVHLSHFIDPMVHTGSIILLTDCVTEFITEDFRLLSSVSLAIVNVSLLSRINPGMLHESKPFIVMHLPEEESRIAAKQIYDSYQLQAVRAHAWQPTILIIRREIVRTELEQLLQVKRTFSDIRLYHDCTMYIIFQEVECSPPPPTLGNWTLKLKLTVWEGYAVKRNRTFKLISTIHVPVWTGGEAPVGEQVSLDDYARRRRNFQLEKFSASVKYDPYFTDWVKLEKKGNDSYSIVGGYVSYLYRDLQLLMNFTEEIVLGDSPIVFPNGSVYGQTAAQLHSGEADLTLNQISYSVQRAKAFTFLQPTYHSLVYVFFKQPAQSSIRDIVIAAFTKELWISVIGVWAIFVIAIKGRLLLLSKGRSWEKVDFLRSVTTRDYRFSKESVLWSVAAFSQKYYKRNVYESDSVSEKLDHISDAFGKLFCTERLLLSLKMPTQPWYLDPQKGSLRMTVLIGSLASLILYNAYSGSIVSHLAVSKIPVKTFDDLITFKFTFTVHEKSEPFQTLLEGMIDWYSLSQEVTTISTEREISHLYTLHPANVKSTGVAFLSPADMFFKTAEAGNFSSNFMCDHISSLHAGSYAMKSAMLVRKASEYREVLNYMLVYLRQRGLIDRNIESYNAMNLLKCIPIEQRESTVDPAEFSDVFTILLVLFVGLPLAVLLLLVEMTYSKGSQPKTVKRRRNEIAHKQAYFDDLATCYTP